MNCSPALFEGCTPEGSLTFALEETTLEREVDRLLAELPERFGLIGLSLGANVAMALIAKAPGRVSRLCLMSTNPSAPNEAQYAGWRAWRDQLAAGRSARDLQRDLIPKLLSRRAQADPEGVEHTLRIAEETGATRLDRQLQLQASRIDLWPGLSAITCPTLIIAARDDALCSVGKHQEIQRRIPGSRLVIVEDCGHLTPVEQPDQLRALWAAGATTATLTS